MREFDDKYYTRDAYKMWHQDHTRFNDLDTLGHVNSNRMQEFFVSARTRLLKSLLADWPHGPVATMLKLSTVTHEGELHFPGTADTGLVLEKAGRTSFTVMMGMFEGDRCVAVAKNVFVFIDQKTRKPVEPPESARDALQKAA